MQTSGQFVYDYFVMLGLCVHECPKNTEGNCNQSEMSVQKYEFRAVVIHERRSFQLSFTVYEYVVVCFCALVCMCASRFLLGCLSKMTSLIRITIGGKYRLEKGNKWEQEKPGFSEHHNFRNISITKALSRSMMGTIFIPENSTVAGLTHTLPPI